MYITHINIYVDMYLHNVSLLFFISLLNEGQEYVGKNETKLFDNFLPYRYETFCIVFITVRINFY